MLKEQMTGLLKLEHLMKEDLRFSQDYVKTKSLKDARLEFRWQTTMLDNRANMGRRYSGKTCPHCEDGREDGAIESSRHWLTCEPYSELRAVLTQRTLWTTGLSSSDDSSSIGCSWRRT